MSQRTVAALLQQAAQSLQANVKTTEGNQHPDRDAQFADINDTVRRYRRSGDPVISVEPNSSFSALDPARPTIAQRNSAAGI